MKKIKWNLSLIDTKNENGEVTFEMDSIESAALALRTIAKHTVPSENPVIGFIEACEVIEEEKNA